MKKNELKKYIIIICCVLIISIGITFVILFFNRKIEDSNTDIIIENLNYVIFDESSSISDKIDLIKNNIVRVVNTIDDDIQIVGTGFFDTDGYLITNSHVVDIKGDIKVIYNDNSSSKATIFSNDIVSDVALLKVDNVNALALKLDETLSLKTADTLYALGYPLNLEGEATVTKGILSARRSVAGIEYLQTDASLDNGSSGGPLVNENGGVVGINALASNTSDINFALSSETIQNVITKLKNTPTVKYIDNERPENGLSNVLKEVGYTDADIYNEWDIINEVYHLHIGGDKKEETKSSSEPTVTKVLDSDSLAQNISISGYDSDFSFNSYEYSYKFHLQNDEDSLNISVIPNSSKASYKIVGNSGFKLGSNTVSIIVMAENGSKTTYTFYVMKPIVTIEGIVGVSCPCSIPNGPSTIFLSCSVVDASGNNLYSSDYPTHIINTVSASMYVKVDTEEESTKVIDGDFVKYLKSYSFKESSSTTLSRISTAEIKSLLTDDNYDNDFAKIYFEITVNTFKDGSYNTISTYQLSK